MKHLEFLATSALCGLALLASAGPATAQIVKQNPETLIGSDTLDDVMDEILAELKLSGAVSPNGSGGIDVWAGIGSSAGERQMEGSPSGSEPTCLPLDANGLPEGNPGCQEISAMSRAMDSSICDDDNAATNAEGLAIGRDGIAIVTNNAACTGVPATTNNEDPNSNVPIIQNHGTMNFRNSGTLQSGAYQIGANFPGEEWKDVVRLLWTGCANNQGTCSTVNRSTRCSSAVRQELVNSWSKLFNDADCTGCTSLRRVFRRDDSSGTTQVFLEFIGVAVNLTSRSAVFGGLPAAVTQVPEGFSFCDGGESEGFFPAGGATAAGDPIKTACDPDEDLCGVNGTMGLVQAVKSPNGNALDYPTDQCDRGSFRRVAFMNTSFPVCPDGTSPAAGRCNLPVRNNGGTLNFNCLNDPNSRPSTVPVSVDGRVYNYVVRDSSGNVVYLDSAQRYPDVATWRNNMAVLRTGFGQVGGPITQTVCQEANATRQIGCLTARDTCSIGFAGREAATVSPYDDAQEPVRLQGASPSNTEIIAGTYPFARLLYVNALNGFENITADCLAARGIAAGAPGSEYCEDQLAIAQTFHNAANYTAGGQVNDAMVNAGYIPLPAPVCEGTQAAAGCGRPTVQTLADCTPQ